MSIPRNLSKLAEGTDSSGVLGIAYGGTGGGSQADAKAALGLHAVATSGSYADLLNKPTTANIVENTNLYFTDARARASVSASGSLSYNSATGVFSYTTPSTSGISEGTNLYYTDARARGALSASTGISYNSTTGAISTTITQYTDTLARGAVSASGDLSYNSATGVFSYTTPSTSGIVEGTNLYFTDARARASISVTGAGSYNSTTGVINIVGGVTSFNTRTGAITLSSADVTGALGFTPYNATNPSGYISGITSGMVTTALGFTPYNATNPNNYITVAQARSAISVTGSGSYDSTTGVITVTGGVTSVNSRTGAVTIGSADVTGALGFTPYNATNPNGYITGITSSNVTTALGFTPYNSTNPSGYISGITSGMVTTALGYIPYNSSNPSGYITSSALSGYLTTSGKAADSNLLDGYDSTSFSGPNSTIKQFFWNDLGASGSQARTFEIARIAIDFNDWNGGSGPFEVELYEKYYSRGLKKKYVISYGYTQTSSIQLIEYSGSGDNNFQCRISSPVQVSGDNYYISVFVDVRHYAGVDVRVTTNRTTTTSNPPSAGTTFINSAPTPTNISDFSSDSTVNFASTSNVQITGNQLLHAGNYSSYALPLSGGTVTGQVTLSANGNQLSFVRADGTTPNWTFHGWSGGLNIYSSVASTVYIGRDGPGTSLDVFNGSLTQGGNQVLHAGNYTGFNSIIRALGYPSSSNDWNSLGNGYQNSIIQVDPSNFSSTTNGPTAASYTYGTLLNFAAMSSSQAQIFISHAGNDLIFRGGWNGNAWQTWNKVLTNQNYNSYSPTLTGGNASGTWGINITGNAGSVTNGLTTSNYTSYAPNISQLTAGYSVSNFDAIKAPGLYQYDGSMTSTPNGRANYRSIEIGSSGRYSQIALPWDQDGMWFRRQTGSDWSAWREVLHSSNYSSYAVPLSGGTMSGRLTISPGWTTSGRNYSNEWIEFGGYSGLYSPQNGAHFYPNNGTYGGWRSAGSRNGWHGIEFDSSNGNTVLMIGSDGNTSGFHNNNSGWQFRWASGELHVYKNSYGGGTDAIVLDAANYTNYSPGSGSTWTFGNIYANNWFRSNSSGNGMYNQATGQHWYSDDSAYWNMGGNNGGQGIRFRDTHNGTVRGYVYYDTGNSIGFLNNNGNWRLRVVGGDYTLADGSSMRAPLFYDSNDTNYYVDPASTSSLKLLNVAGYSIGCSATIDLTGYDQNTYYPVGISLSASQTTRIKINVGLNSSSTPSWSTHPAGFTLVMDWENNGGGWGTTTQQRQINAFTYGWSNVNPCGGISQNNQASLEFVYLRGGGRYFVQVSGLDTSISLYANGYDYGGTSHYARTSILNDVWSSATGSGVSVAECRASTIRASSNSFSPIYYHNTDTGYYLAPNDTGTSLRVAGNITAYYSDMRLKKYLGKIENAKHKVCQLEGFYYEANELAQSFGYKPKREVGVSAQAVQSVLPEIVTDAPINSNYLTIDYERLTPLLVEAIKEQDNEIVDLKTRVAQLEALIEKLIKE